jgi:hypothetical protein
VFFQNGGERRSSVFGIDIDAPAEDCLMANIAARKVETAFYQQVSFVFDLLRDDFAEDELLSEIFGSDYDAIFARGAAGCQHSHYYQQR